jgi:hypothetical protein
MVGKPRGTSRVWEEYGGQTGSVEKQLRQAAISNETNKTKTANTYSTYNTYNTTNNN